MMAREPSEQLLAPEFNLSPPKQTLATAQVMPHRVFAQNGPLVIIWPQAVGPKRRGLGLVYSLGGNDAVPGMSLAGPGQECSQWARGREG